MQKNENCFIQHFGWDANDYIFEQSLRASEKQEEDKAERECIDKLGYAYYL